MLCPTCRNRLDERRSACSEGHRFRSADGVLCLLEDSFRERLERFLAGFEQVREQRGRRIHDPALFPRLPQALRRDHEWRVRCYDLAVIRRLVHGRTPGTALDVGAWNGWLSHHLALAGWRVTAVDYFTDALDGLGAHRCYPTEWRAIQLDLRDLGVLGETFDVVVVNRCLQFFVDPAAAVRNVLARVTPGGTLILTGLHFYADSRAQIDRVERHQTELARHGLTPFVPIKGFLDPGDREELRQLGVDLQPYPQLKMRLGRLKGRLRPALGEQLYGVLER